MKTEEKKLLVRVANFLEREAENYRDADSYQPQGETLLKYADELRALAKTKGE